MNVGLAVGTIRNAGVSWKRAGMVPRRGLLDFVLATHPDYKAGPFHRRLCTILEEFSRDVARGASPRLILAAPPQHGKSLLVSQALPIFHLAHNPNHHVAVASYGADLAEDHLRKSRFLLASSYVAKLWPHLVPGPRDSLLVHRADLDEVPGGGGMRAIGVGGGLSGKPETMLVMDDLLKDRMEADSALVRERVWSWICDVAMPRIPDGGGALLMSTRWHEDDPTGRLMTREPGRWKYIWFPAIAEVDDEDRKIGELLDPNRYGAAFYAEVQGRSDRTWQALYQQSPIAQSGGMFQRSWFDARYVTPPEVMAQGCDEIAVSVDSATKSKAGNDPHSIHVWGRKGARRILLARRAGRWEYPAFANALDGVIAEWGPIARSVGATFIVLVEDTANGATYLQLNRDRVPNLIPFNPNMTPGKDKGKATRATYLQHPAEAGQVELPDATMCPWAEDVLDWWCAFPLGAHDDDVDAASQILMRWELGSHVVSAVDAFSWMAEL